MATSPEAGTGRWAQDPRAWDLESVLDYGPQLHRRGLEWQQRFEILWPVHAWRIVVPVGERAKLDPLQRVVLRLRRAGLMEPEELATRVGVDPELVVHLAAELRDLGYLDDLGRVSEHGAFALEDLIPANRSLRTGWVFQEAVGGEWLPRFTTELNDIDVEPDDRGFPLVRRGTRGDPRLDPAFVVPALRPHADCPQANDILDLLRRHRRDLRRLKRAGTDLTPYLAPAGERLEGSPKGPEAYHLRTFVYVPHDLELEGQPWYVAEPFGFGASPLLRSLLESLRLEQDEGIRRRLDLITGVHLHQARSSWEAMNGLLREQAERIVDEGFPGTAVDAAEVRNALVEAHVALGSAQEAAKQTPPPALPASHIGGHLRGALELALQALHRRSPPGDAWQRLFQRDLRTQLGKALRKRTLQECGVAVGFPVLPSAVHSPSPGRVQEAAQRVEISNLRPKVAAFILAATSAPDHPLRRLAQAAPDWIIRADDLVDQANKAVHPTSRQRVTLEVVEGWAESALALCRELFEAMAPAPVTANRRTEESSSDG